MPISKKLIMTALGVTLVPLMAWLGVPLTDEQLLAIVGMIASYNAAQGMVDMKKVKNA